MIRVFIGFDSRETIAWHVLQASIIERTRHPVSFCAVGNELLDKSTWQRPRGPHDSTEFSSARFLVPALCGFKGWAIFMDCDMVCGEDIAELWDQRDERCAVMCVPHTYNPSERVKFLGAEQTQYHRKNWSSLMLLNCAHPSTRNLTLDYVNKAPGLDLHGMGWAEGNIGHISGTWNVLSVDKMGTPGCLQHPEISSKAKPVKLLHYTRGGPWHGEYFAGAELWINGLVNVFKGNNPMCQGMIETGSNSMSMKVRYGSTEEVISNGEG